MILKHQIDVWQCPEERVGQGLVQEGTCRKDRRDLTCKCANASSTSCGGLASNLQPLPGPSPCHNDEYFPRDHLRVVCRVRCYVAHIALNLFIYNSRWNNTALHHNRCIVRCGVAICVTESPRHIAEKRTKLFHSAISERRRNSSTKTCPAVLMCVGRRQALAYSKHGWVGVTLRNQRNRP